MKTLHPYSRIAVFISAILLISAYYLPLWQILMWAPQYPEGLQMKIWINNITGDVKIISALNHYIGMKHIEVGMFPEFGYMIYIIASVIAIGVITALVNRRALLAFYALILIACGIAALVDFYLWGYQYGHNLDPTAPIIVPGMSYQPPLIGTKQLLNFTAFSGPDTGAWIFFASGFLAVGAFVYEFIISKRIAKQSIAHASVVILGLMLLSCTTAPEPLQYGKDACHHCKMTIIDNKFGAEIVTTKGKIYKFDDLNCMAGFIKSGSVPEAGIAHCVVINFTTPGEFIDARSAVYIKAEAIKTPMASASAAFKDRDQADRENVIWHGSVFNWSEWISQAQSGHEPFNSK